MKKTITLTSEHHDPEVITSRICFSLQDDRGVADSRLLSQQWICLDLCWHFVKHLVCIRVGDCCLQEKENCFAETHMTEKPT